MSLTAARKRILAKRLLKAALGVVVIAAAGHHVLRTWRDLASRGESVHVDPWWFAAAVGLYAVGLLPFASYYTRVLEASATPIRALAAIRAYYLSHLGKYVPGKALVVVMRAGLSAKAGARPATAAFATLYETLVMMATGGWIAAIGFVLAPTHGVSLTPWKGTTWNVPLPLLGAMAAFGFTLLVEARVFRQLSRLISLPFPGVSADALPRLGPGLLGAGMLWNAIGWIFLGLSQLAVLRGMGLAASGQGVVPAVIASVALATVAGFAVPLSPGGLGVREWVLWTSLGTLIDRDHAVVAALILRLAWIVGEIVAAAVVGPARLAQQRQGSS